MRFFFVVVSAVLVGGCAMLPPPYRLAMSETKFTVRDLKLPNGLRIVVDEEFSTGQVAVVAIVGAGASSDPKGKEGLAHFVEHLAYRARPDGKLTAAQMYDFAGTSEFNAVTSLDDTTYYALGPKEALPALLAILGAQLVDPAAAVPKETVDVERAVALNELRFRTETGVSGLRAAWMNAAAFPAGHKYARPVVGTAESIAALTLDDVQKFTAQHYRPANITLQITGAVDAAQLKAVLASLPPALTEGEATPKPTFGPRVKAGDAEPPESPEGKLVTQKALGIDDPELDIVWTLPSPWGPNGTVQSFVANAIDAAIFSALFRDDDIAFIQTHLVPAADAALLHVRVGLRHGEDPEKSLERILDRLMNVWTQASHPFINGSRVQALTSSAIGASDLVTRGLARASATHYLGEPAAYSRQSADLARIEVAQVLSFAEKYVTRGRARAVLLTPVPEAERPAVVATGVGTRLASDPTPTVQYPREEVLKCARQPKVSDAKRFTLENGLQVLILPRGGMPLVSVALALEGGDDDAEPLGADLADWLGDPTNTIHGYAFQWGIQRTTALEDHAHLITWQGPNGNLANLLAVASDQVGSMRVSGGIIPRYRERSLAREAELEARPRAQLQRRLKAALYPQHRYGQVATSKEYGEMGAGELNDWLDTVYQPAGAKLVIVGQIDATVAEQQVRSWFGGWGSGRARPAHALPALPQGPSVVLAPRAGATQTELSLACRLPDAKGPARLANQLLASLLEVRLEDTLRQKLGATYAVSARAQGGAAGTAILRVTTAVSAEDQTRALEALRKTWTGLGVDGWDLAEIDRARWTLARDSSGWSRTNQSLARHLAQAWSVGADPAELETFPATLVELGDVELEQSWKTCSATTVLGVLGDPGVAGPLKQTGWAK